MWHRDGPTFLTDNVWVGISFDGTKLWQASFVHFAVGDLGSHMPLGSWILLRGSEKKAIITHFGMQRSRAWCGTPPILGVVNMVGTRNFTCYMGAL